MQRLAIVHQVDVDGDVRGARVEVRRLDLANDAPGRQPLMFFVTSVQFAPPSRVFQTLPSLVPAQISPRWIFDGAMRKHHLAIELPEVVADDAAGRDDPAGILGATGRG